MEGDYISREAAVKIAEKYGLADGSVLGRHTGLADCIASEISALPAADVAEVVHGQWCVSKIRSIETVFYCSECKRTVTVGNDFFGEAPKNVSAAYPYCHCGAKMDGGNDDATD
jgi:hypothetical protein